MKLRFLKFFYYHIVLYKKTFLKKVCTKACFNQYIQETFSTQRTFVFQVSVIHINFVDVFGASLVTGRVIFNKILFVHSSILPFFYSIWGVFLELDHWIFRKSWNGVKNNMKLWFLAVIETFTHYLLLNSVCN